VSHFWLTYQKAGRLVGVVILESSSPGDARKRASGDQIDQGAQFASGSGLDRDLARLVPLTSIGRMLAPEEAYALLELFDRSAPTRPPAINRA
jgi:hypothetical protein